MHERISVATAERTRIPHESRSSDVSQPVSPPPYDPNGNSSVFVAETTTTRTEVVTTTTTTHFFSLSPWRKRSFANLLHQNTDTKVNGLREANTFPPSSSAILVEKELPPTPPHDQQSTDIVQTSSASTDKGLADESFTQYSASPSADPPNTPSGIQSTVVLARAALGLGLPHVLPHAATPSSEANISVSSAISPVAKYDVNVPENHRNEGISPNSKRERPAPIDVTYGEDRRRRSRSVSFGASLLKFGSANIKGKSKEEEVNSQSSIKVSPKTISRRPSFWSRKKPENVILSSTTSKRAEDRFTPSLTLPPISPFDANITINPSSPPSPHYYRNTQRSFERGNQTTETIGSRRPATANPCYGRHTSRFTTVEPLGTPEVLMCSSRRYQKPTTSQRPRSLTNPHELSLSPLDQSITVEPPLPGSFSPSSQDTRSRPNSSTSSGNSLDKGLKFFSSGDTQGSGKSQTPPRNKSQSNPPIPLKDQESPELYLDRLKAAVSKVEIAGILASSADTFHVQALRTYIGQFDFVDDPLDVALRRLLMEVGLPRETQQIDRVVEAFAGRYVQCNPNLFTSEDHPYILAFSLIMLHTDAFNKSNKRKMTRAAYVKNARLPGVASDVLDCFYDNIVFAPFIFIEDPVDVNGQRGVSPAALTSHPPTRASQSGAASLMRGNKIDPYYLIANNLLGPLRLNVDDYVPMEHPYAYEGTAGPWDEAQLRLAFAKAGEMEVNCADHGLMSPFFGLGMGGGSPGSRGSAGTPSELSSSDVWTLKVTKVGLLNRKDDILEGGKKASNRKWKLWSVVLTGSQLLFFRDSSWSTSMLAQTVPSDGHVIFPQQAVFKPDEVLSVKNALAVIDKSYTKHDNTLRFVLADGRQIFLQAAEAIELNEWIAKINYASAFKSAGIRMRPLDMSGIDVKLTGVAAAASHLRDLEHHGPSKGRGSGRTIPEYPGSNFLGDLELRNHGSSLESIPLWLNRVDLGVPVAPEIDGARQFETTFDQVKADLAVGCWPSSKAETSSSSQASKKPQSTNTEDSHLPSRSKIMQAKIQDLESRITAAQAHLDAEMRFVRNVATLTPFQKSTRDRLVVALQAVSKRIMQVRLEITKLTCHRDVLSKDLVSEGQSWRRAKTAALQAARETLQHRLPNNPPQLTLPQHRPTAQSHPQFPDTPSPRRAEPSLCESFHCALDFGPNWISTEDLTSPESVTTPPFFESLRLSSSLSHSHVDMKSTTSSPRSSSLTVQSAKKSPRTSGESGDQERFHSTRESFEEQAEAWNRTRCAQRVSLVKMPSFIQMPLGRNQSDRA